MYSRRLIICVCMFLAVGLQWLPKAVAVPHLQLYIDGATYDVPTETWVFQYTPDVPFTLQVIGAKDPINGVLVSTALLGVAEGTDISSVNIDFAATNYTGSDFTWGQPPKLQPSHSVFPAYYVEEGVGDFGLVETVYDMKPGESGSATGEIKEFAVTIHNTDLDVHFDAYNTYVLPSTKLKAVFAPQDGGATPIPEPATIAILGMGIVGLLGYKGRRFLRKS
jgi:hypothetical protein